MFRGPATINLYADDVSAAAEWYADLLGVAPYYRRPEEGEPAYIEFRFGDAQTELGIIDRRWAPPTHQAGPGGVVVNWAVDDLDAAAAECVGLGATLPDEQPGETWRVLLDPSGHPFCLTQAANWG